MLKTLKPFIISLIIIALGYASIALAAPYFRQEASLVPIDSTENIGTSTSRWAEGWFGSINVTSCTGCGSSPFPFTVASWGVSTSTTVGFLNGLMSTASSTFTVAPIFSSLTSALIQTDGNGLTAEYAGTSCTNQFVRSLSVLGVATCATVSSSDVSLANLTATDSTLTFSGIYNGATARTIGLNLSNANTWTGGQIFGNATATSATTTSLFSTTASSTNLAVGGTFRLFTEVWSSISDVATYVRSLFTGGRSLTYSAGNFDIDSEIFTFGVAANLVATTTADGISTTTEDFLSVKIPIASTVTAIDCYADTTGTSTIKASYSSNPLAAGTQIVSAGTTCGSQVLTNVTSFNNSSVGAGNWLRVWVHDASPTGSRPNRIYFTVTMTKND